MSRSGPDFRAQNEARLERKRNEQRLCALDFLTWGDEQGEHRKRCVNLELGLPPCSRDYHPGPMPDNEKMYEGTGIGLLFGLGVDPSGPNPHAWQLAGWNITRRKDAA